jgi:rRNA biogenesis protein RRP5
MESQVRVLGKGEGGEVDLSLRASHLAGAAGAKKAGSKSVIYDTGVGSVTQLAPGAAVTGFVKQCTKGGTLNPNPKP